MSGDLMPKEVATLSDVKRALEKIFQRRIPPQIRLQRKLTEASAAQLHKWYKRALRLANRYQDQRDDISFDAGFSDDAKEILIGRLDPKLAEMNEICEATQTELDKRANRGKVNP